MFLKRTSVRQRRLTGPRSRGRPPRSCPALPPEHWEHPALLTQNFLTQDKQESDFPLEAFYQTQDKTNVFPIVSILPVLPFNVFSNFLF